MKNLKKIFISLILIFCIFTIFCENVSAKEVNVYMFYGKTCPHCEEALKYLESIKEKYDLNIIKYEVWENGENIKIMDEVSEIVDINVSGVPFCVIDNTGIIGYSAGITDETYKYHIKKALEDGFKDNVGIKLGLIDEEIVSNTMSSKEKSFVVNIPFIGNQNLKNKSLPIVSMILGIKDGLNLCSLWILLFIISFLLGIHNKKRVLVLGITFLISSALIYLGFIVSALSFSKILSLVIPARLLISLVSIMFGTTNINRHLKENDNNSSLKDNTKIRQFIYNKSFIIFFVAIILFAVLTNIIELSCSAGISDLFLKLLSVNNVGVFEYIIYIVIYLLFFMLDNLIIFIILTKVIDRIGLFVKYSKYIRLISGILMFVIGVLLLSKPEWLMFDF